MSVPAILLLAAGGWVAVVLSTRLLIVPVLRRGPGGDPVIGLVWYLGRLYCRFFHGARFEGQEQLRDRPDAGPLIVISNHTSPVDPLLIACACRFPIRWLTAAEMMMPELDWLWKRQRMIPVEREGGEGDPNRNQSRLGTPSTPLREAARHLKAGGVIGIFPEGRIVRPGGEIRPFQRGVGVLASRSGARVMLVWVSGTPQPERLSYAFFVPSRSRVRFIDLIEFRPREDPEEICRQLRRRLTEASGWPLNDEPMPAAATPGRRRAQPAVT